MEEKTYPVIEEEDGYGCMKAAEPTEALAYDKVAAYDVKEGIEYANSIILPFLQKEQISYLKGRRIRGRRIRGFLTL